MIPRRPMKPLLVNTGSNFELPDAFLPLLWKEWPADEADRSGPIRYKCFYGGRGAARSWSFARALIAEAYTEKHLILCTREYQNTIADSVKRVLEEQIRLMGLDHWFYRDKQTIRCELTGSEFLFKGLRHDVQGIRSLEGVTRVWLEEGQWVTADSWLILDPTIRGRGSQIWVSYNPVNLDDPTHQMFAVKPPPDALVRKVSWRDNPWFDETDLPRLRARMFEQDQSAYDWVWEGEIRQVTDATIFKGQYEVHGFDLPEIVERYFYGIDWGFANDPLAAVRCYITGNERDGQELWIDHEFYSTAIELDDTPVVLKGGRSERTGAVYEGIPGIADWPIKADPSRPESISYVRRHGGMAISAAETWKGSVEDGISHLKAFKKIHIHTRCPNMAQEARLYSYKIDPKTKDQDKPVILPVAADAFNHAWDAVRYALDGYIQHRGGLGVWRRLVR